MSGKKGIFDGHPVLEGLAWAAVVQFTVTYARAYLVRVKGADAARKFFRRSIFRACSWSVLTVGLIVLAALQGGFNPVAVSFLAGVVLLGGPVIRAIVYVKRELAYRRSTRGPLAGRIQETAHDVFPRIFQ